MSGRIKQLALAAALVFLVPAVNYVRDVHAAIVQGYQVAVWLNQPVAVTPDGMPIARGKLLYDAAVKEAAAQQLTLLKPATK